VEEDSVVVVLAVAVVVATPEVEVQGSAGVTSAVEEDSVLLDQDSVVVPGTTLAKACVSLILIRAPGSFVLRFVNRPRLPGRIAG
jgi:hypothetical protein